MQKLFKSSRFQADYDRFNAAIAKMEGKKQEDAQMLLGKLVALVKRLDESIVEMAYEKKLPTAGADLKDDILDTRKSLEEKLHSYL